LALTLVICSGTLTGNSAVINKKLMKSLGAMCTSDNNLQQVVCLVASGKLEAGL
jgi:hypothetical protein